MSDLVLVLERTDHVTYSSLWVSAPPSALENELDQIIITLPDLYHPT